MSTVVTNVLESLDNPTNVVTVDQLVQTRVDIFLHLKRLAAEAGFNLVDGSFEEGAVVSESNDVVWFRNEGTYYGWGGIIPVGGYIVPAGATPATTGGIGVGAWTDKTDLMLRTDMQVKLSTVSVGGIGDYKLKDQLFIFCGDSTTEQMGGNGYGFDSLTSVHRSVSGDLKDIKGTINFGGSGQQMSVFIDGALQTLPTVSGSNLGVGQWDYFGHKPVGAVSLKTATAWRDGKADKVTWVICYGINDCILNASIGNLPKQDISDYIADGLQDICQAIHDAHPADSIILRIPNPMVARPFNPAAGFPSPTQYPDFGSDLNADQDLVEKWNQGLRDGYLSVAGKIPRAVVFDTWEWLFLKSDPTLLASTQQTLLGNLVHPSLFGYTQLLNAFVEFITGKAKSSSVVGASSTAAAVGKESFSYYPDELDNNPRYQLKLVSNGWVSIGSTYVDVAVSLSNFFSNINTKNPIYVKIGDDAAQKFSSYSLSSIGSNTRIFSITVNADMISNAGGIVRVYQDSMSLQTQDGYLLSQIASLSPRYSYFGGTASAGNGYIDVNFNSSDSRFSSKYTQFLNKGKLLIGGSIQATVDLSGLTIARGGTSSQRTIRILKTGDWSSYANTEAVLYFDDSAPSPIIGDNGAVTQRGVVAHAQNNRAFVHCPYEMKDGATINIGLTEPIASAVTVDIYNPHWATRTLIGTVTIPVNAGDANLSSGNPTTISAGSIFEAVITSATSQTTGLVVLSVIPN